MPLDASKNPSASFANYFEVGCTEEEIIVRFGLRDEHNADPTLQHTLFTTPGYARRLIELLQETLRQHAELTAQRKRSEDANQSPVH